MPYTARNFSDTNKTMDPRTKRPTPYDLMQAKAPKKVMAEREELLGLWKHYRQRTGASAKK